MSFETVMSITENLNKIQSTIPADVCLVAVSKTKPIKDLLEAYQSGQRIFGENKVQEMADKHKQLPDDIKWHMIGHVQRNKVKYMADFVDLIHAVDSMRLLKEINKQAAKHGRIINCLLQIKIAKEESKFGMNFKEAEELLSSKELSSLKNVAVKGLMGMATFTSDMSVVKGEFDF
jgi:pyridoxal phosphate enzyme (YggS family)